MARITIVSGHYGAGKSEFAVNLAMQYMEQAPDVPVTLVDLDVVNPYFRSREARQPLEEHGVHVVGNALGIDAGVDLPAVPAGVAGALRDTARRTIVDLGGDPAGTFALRQFRPSIPPEDTEFLCVINAFRPETTSVEAALDLMRAIESALGMRVQGVVNNSHMLGETTVEHVLAGDRLCRELCELSDELTVAWVAAVPAVIDDLPDSVAGRRLSIGGYLRQAWMNAGST